MVVIPPSRFSEVIGKDLQLAGREVVVVQSFAPFVVEGTIQFGVVLYPELQLFQCRCRFQSGEVALCKVYLQTGCCLVGLVGIHNGRRFMLLDKFIVAD